MHVYACLHLCFISMFACLDLGFAMLCALHGLMLVGLWGHLLVWLHPSLLWIVWMWPLVRYTSMVLVCLMHTLSLLRALLCLPCLLCATHLAFIASLHLCTLAYMFIHESVCCPYSNFMELWTPNPNLHLSSWDTLYCLITCLFAPVWLFFW